MLLCGHAAETILFKIHASFIIQVPVVNYAWRLLLYCGIRL